MTKDSWTRQQLQQKGRIKPLLLSFQILWEQRKQQGERAEEKKGQNIALADDLLDIKEHEKYYLHVTAFHIFKYSFIRPLV